MQSVSASSSRKLAWDGLLKDFSSVAGSAYTTVHYAQDWFYLADTEKSGLLLDALYFLPAADCASQLKLTYTAYDAGGTQLGTGELTILIATKQSSSVFSDVNAGTCAWAADAVDFMNEYGLIQGADKSTFNWRGSMTRRRSDFDFVPERRFPCCL